jgi:hypothetical protein
MADRNEYRKTDHLKPFQWKPGQSGNPAGKPPWRTMRERLKRLVEAPATDFPFAVEVARNLGLTAEDIAAFDLGDTMLLSGFLAAFEGKGPQFAEIMQRLDGRVTGQFNDEPPDTDAVADMTIEDHRTAAVALYRGIIRDPNSTAREKMQAQDALNRLLGLVVEEDGMGNPEEIAARVRAFLRATDTETPDADDDDRQGDDAVEGTSPAPPAT